MTPVETRRGAALDGHLHLDQDSSYEAVVNALPLPAIATDRHGVVRIWNQAAECVFGWSADEILGHRLPTLPEAAQCEFDHSMARILEGGTITGVETSRQRRDGTMIDLRVSASPLCGRDGAIIGALATFEDITREKKAREAAAESERRLDAIFNQTFQFIGLLSLDGTLLEANQTALGWSGSDRSQVVGRPFWDTPWWTFSSEAQERLQQAVQSAAHGSFVRYEIDAPHPETGRISTFDFSITPVKDEGGNVVLLIPEGRDITERKRFEKALAKHAEVLRTQSELLNLARDAILVLDPADSSVVFWNKGAETLYGWTETEVLGHVSHELLQTEFPEPLEQIQAELSEHYRWDGELVHTGRDGSRIVVRSYWVLQRDVEGRPQAILQTNHDITAHKEAGQRIQRLNAQLKERVEELGQANELILRWNAELEQKVAERTREIQRYSQEMTTHVLHAQEEERKRIARELHDDTAQSLSSLLISLDLLERNMRGNASTLSAGIKRAQGIAKRTLDSTRALAHGLRPTILDDFGLDAALEWIAVDHTRTYGVPVTVSSEEVPAGRLDGEAELALFRIAQEALTNSGKHAGAASAHIALSATDGGVVLVVEDDGSGFDVERLAAPTREGGLGLHGIRERVQLLGADLDVHSAPGEGTRLTITVPRARKGIGAGREPARSAEEGVLV